MDRFASMTTFVAVVDAGSFSAAARRLGMPLATVSRKVAELEAELRVPLLTRSTRSIALTDAGRGYVESCRALLEQLAEAERLASGQYSAPRGRLVIGAPTAFGRLYLAPIIVAFLKAYPEIDVELRLGEQDGNMIEEQQDVAIRIGALADSGLVAIRAGSIRHVVCASPGYLESRGTPAHPQQLLSHDCVTLLPGESATEWLFRDGAAVTRAPVRSRLCVTAAETAVDAAIAGLGLAHLFCYQVSDAVTQGRLRVLLHDFEPAPFPVHVVHAQGRQVPQKLRAFLDFTVPRLREELVFSQ